MSTWTDRKGRQNRSLMKVHPLPHRASRSASADAEVHTAANPTPYPCTNLACRSRSTRARPRGAARCAQGAPLLKMWTTRRASSTRHKVTRKMEDGLVQIRVSSRHTHFDRNRDRTARWNARQRSFVPAAELPPAFRQLNCHPPIRTRSGKLHKRHLRRDPAWTIMRSC